MKTPMIHVAGMIFNEPHAILREKFEVILRALGPRLEVNDAALDELVRMRSIPARPVLMDDVVVIQAQMPGDNGEKEKPYRLTPEGVAVIPIRGTLMKRFSWLSAASGLSTYQGLAQAATAAQMDPMVKAILFDVDSPGGTTHGCFELSEALYEMRGDKPMWACANDLAASAAYALASATDRLYVTRTGAVGSIGVFALHADQSGMDEQAGVKYTYVSAGDKKTDGNPHEALSKSARADIQAEVDREYAMFVQCVARNRGKDPGKIQGTEAGVYFAQNAVPLLADDVATFDETLEALTAKVNGSKLKSSGKLAQKTAASNNAPNLEGEVMPAIPSHHTATSDKGWDGPRAKKNLRQGEAASYYRSAFAFAKPGGDPKTKAGYTFIHHEVSSGGDVGAANIKACQTSIGVLNGGRGGTVLKGSDRRGVYNHVAAHLRDAKLEPKPLASYQDYIAAMLASAREEPGYDAIRDIAMVYLLAETGEQKGETAMLNDKRAKKADAEDAKAVAAAEDDEKDDDEEDDEKKKKDDGEDDDEEADEGKRGKKGESKKSESKKAEKKDDEDDDDKGKRGSVTEMPVAANAPAKRIAELCQIAGAPELAADYIMKGYTVDRVIEKLSARRSKASAEGAVNSYVSGEGSGTQMSVEQAIQQANTISANSGGNLKPSQALERMLRSNPEIYEGYMNERDMVISQSPGGRGPALTGYVLGKQRRYMAALGLGTNVEDVPAHRQM